MKNRHPTCNKSPKYQNRNHTMHCNQDPRNQSKCSSYTLAKQNDTTQFTFICGVMISYFKIQERQSIIDEFIYEAKNKYDDKLDAIHFPA